MITRNLGSSASTEDMSKTLARLAEMGIQPTIDNKMHDGTETGFTFLHVNDVPLADLFSESEIAALDDLANEFGEHHGYVEADHMLSDLVLELTWQDIESTL